MEFREWLKEERKKHNFSAKKLSERLGKSRNYVSQFEQGSINEIPYETAVKIVNILGLDEDALSPFYFEQATVRTAKDTAQELIDQYNDVTKDKQIRDMENGTLGPIIDLEKKFERALDRHISMMSVSEMAGILLLLSKQRHLVHELAAIPSKVKPEKVTHLYDMIHKYTKFMIEEYKKGDKKN